MLCVLGEAATQRQVDRESKQTPDPRVECAGQRRVTAGEEGVSVFPKGAGARRGQSDCSLGFGSGFMKEVTFGPGLAVGDLDMLRWRKVIQAGADFRAYTRARESVVWLKRGGGT